MTKCQVLVRLLACELARLRLFAQPRARRAVLGLRSSACHSQYGLTVPITPDRAAGAAGSARSSLLLYFDVLGIRFDLNF